MAKRDAQLFCLYLAIGLLLSITSTSLAQTPNSGEIQGRVQEAGTQRAIPNATVTIRHQQIGLTRRTVTDANGEYVISFLPVGRYDINGVCQGFETIPNSTGYVTVHVTEKSRVTPPPIELRSSSTPAPAAPVTPPPPPPPTQAAPPSAEQLVNTLNATRGEYFEIRQLQALPLPGIRSFDSLAFLVAGVASPPQAIGSTVGPGIGQGVGTSGQFSVNGLRSRANNFTIDGADNNDEEIGVRRQGFTALVSQPVESVHEFQISTLLPEPQFGRNLGAQVNAVSRPGGMGYHGTLYGFFTDKRLKARDPFDLTGGPATFPIKRASDGAQVMLDGQPLAPRNPVGGENPFTRGQYGAVFGGPVVKEKTHFFLSYEHQDINASQESHFAVPTVADRGLFSKGDQGLQIPGGNGLVNATATSVNGDAIFAYFPFPNNPGGPYGPNTFTEILPASAHGNVFSGRLDQNLKLFGHEQTLAGRYNFTDNNTILPVTGEALFSTLRALVRTQNLALSLNGSLSARLANQLRVSYGRTRLEFNEVRDGFKQAGNNPFLTPSALNNVPFLLNTPVLGNFTVPGGAPQYFTYCLIRGFEDQKRATKCTSSDANTNFPVDTELVNGVFGQVLVSGYSPVGVDVYNFPQGRANNTFQYADTFVYSLGRQRLTGGFDLRRNQLNSFLDRNFRPQLLISGAKNISNQTIVDRIPSFLLGRDFAAAGAPTAALQAQALTPDSSIGMRYWQHNIFLADQIRLRPNFTLTLGARYEVNTVPTEVNRKIESTFRSSLVLDFMAAEREVAEFLGLPKVSGLERFLAGRDKIFRRDDNNFAPHLAFAWDPLGTGKTSLRGGYGIYYDQIPGAVISQSRNVFPNFFTVNLAGLTQDPITGNFCQATDGCLFYFANPRDFTVPGNKLNTYNQTIDLIGFLTDVAFLSNFSGGTGFVLPAADLVTPYSQHWGLTFEREVKRDFLFSLGYVGTRGLHLLRFTTPNLGPNGIPSLTAVLPSGGNPPGPFFFGFVTPPQSPLTGQRPFPLLGAFTSIDSDGNSTYHALQFQVNKRFSRGFQFTTAYTWSHAIDEASDIFDLAGARTLPQNSFDRRAERGNANFDIRHRFAYSFIWDLPLFEKSKLLGGWQLASIGTFETGQPYSVLAGIDANLDGNLTDRVAPGVTNPLQAGAGRNTFRAPGVSVVDLAVNKSFRFGDRHRLEFRSEFFNLFNWSNFGVPVHELFFGGFGTTPTSQEHFVNTRVPARTIQFALKYSF